MGHKYVIKALTSTASSGYGMRLTQHLVFGPRAWAEEFDRTTINTYK